MPSSKQPISSSPILVIDDNPENLRVVVDVLEADGHSIRTARTGAVGLQRAAIVAPALILLDVEMPGLDGYETCRRLKDDPALAEIPVVFMTARADVDDKVRAFEVGAVDYVTKPFELHELLARVRTHLKLGALRAEVSERNRQLEELNTTLQERVEAQVAELVRRAREVELLNAHLRAQVQDRSDALALTLSRLARRIAHSDDEELIGTVLDGRYAIERRIGRGGMGAVYAGHDRHTDQQVAIKVTHSSSQSIEPLLRFIREARVAAAVDHPGVVKMLHIDVHDDGRLFQVQELVAGETLATVLERVGRLGVGPGARLLATLTDALRAAHAAGVSHRDLKPSNILVTRSPPGLKVVDFGIARREMGSPGPTSDPDEAPTVRLEVVGTPRFMSPEQRRADPDVGAPTDIFAVGLLAHLVWTGALPPPGAPASIPAEVAGLVASCLDAEPANRPGAQVLCDALEHLAGRLGMPPLDALICNNALR